MTGWLPWRSRGGRLRGMALVALASSMMLLAAACGGGEAAVGDAPDADAAQDDEAEADAPAGDATDDGDDGVSSGSPSVPDGWADSVVFAGHHSVIPWTISDETGVVTDGVLREIYDELEERAGLTIESALVPFSGILTGVEAGRFDVAGVAGDLPERQETFDFVDFASDQVGVISRADDEDFNPTSILDMCGHTITVAAGGLQSEQIVDVDALCGENGLDPIDIQTLPDREAAVLAVESGRADGSFGQAIAQGARVQTNQALKAAPMEDADQIPDGVNIIGVLTQKDNGAAEFLLSMLQEMSEDGTLQDIFDGHGIGDQLYAMDELGINLAE